MEEHSKLENSLHFSDAFSLFQLNELSFKFNNKNFNHMHQASNQAIKLISLKYFIKLYLEKKIS